MQCVSTRAANKELKRFSRGLPALDTIITLAPLLGLLGTVTGMIQAFGLLGGRNYKSCHSDKAGRAFSKMTTDRFNYYRMKHGNYGMIKGFVLALFIHGVLFFVGGRFFVKPVHYGVQSANEGIDVDLVTALPQPDVDEVKSTASTTEQQQEAVKIMPKEKMATLPQTDTDVIKTITEQHPEIIKVAPQEELTIPPHTAIDAVKPSISTTEQQETVKTILPPSQGTVRTKSQPGYFRNQPPKYPQLAKQMHQEGLVMLMVAVDRKGMPVKVEVEQSSGYQLLDQASLEAVRHWRFQPERIGDIPIESKVTIPIRFCLEE